MNSRYIRTHRSPLPKKVRSKEVFGSFEDSGKYIRCWNCGFIVDTSRNISGNGSGKQFEDFAPTETELSSSGDSSRITLTLDSIGMEGVILENGVDGNPITDYYTPRKVVVYGGCPFCGTKNLP